MTRSEPPREVDGITRPCRVCDTVNIHWPGHQGEHHYEPAQLQATSPAWEAVLAKARQLGRPKHFTSDLFRDYQMLAEQRFGPVNRFLWTAYEYGTFLLFVQDGKLLLSTTSIHRTFGECQWFRWDGSTLTESKDPEADERWLRKLPLVPLGLETTASRPRTSGSPAGSGSIELRGDAC